MSSEKSFGNTSENKNKTVFVMMSGGVDSSVAALKLCQEGYNVVGVFMKCWSIQALDELGVDRDLYGCFWEEDSLDASLVAAKLNIPFFVWDFEQEYKQKVVEYMLESYQKGLTPNPDVMCNSVIKFGLFLKKAKKLGANFVATGHYAKRVDSPDFNIAEIHRGDDFKKDQSYFLWKIPYAELTMMLFPVGNFSTKAEVRKLASDNGLITAAKKDSQGLCFIGTTPLRQLLLQSLGEKPGDILNLEGKVLGQHLGAFLYTIGQREKLGLSGGPWFVSKIDIENNQVIVAHGNEMQVLDKKYCFVADFNWLVDGVEVKQIIDQQKSISAQVRYHQEAVECYLENLTSNKNEDLSLNKATKVFFKEEVRAIAPGQSIVFYAGSKMLGGAVIQANTEQ